MPDYLDRAFKEHLQMAHPEKVAKEISSKDWRPPWQTMTQ